jgi:hypothetical protein
VGTLPLGSMSEHDERPTTGTPTGAGEPDSTGDDRVDQALTRLAELDDRPVHDHAAVVEEVHRALQDALAEDEG